jgi:spermidine/putrescine transport system permease protein
MTTITAPRPLPAAAAQRRAPRPAPLEYGRRAWLRTVLFLSFVFLYAPIFTLIAFSFNNSRRNVTWEGFMFDYYIKAFNNRSLHDTRGTASSSRSSHRDLDDHRRDAGTGAAAISLSRKRTVRRPVHLPIVIPEVCMAAAMLVSLRAQCPLRPVHHHRQPHCLQLPFVAVVRSRMAGFDESL